MAFSVALFGLLSLANGVKLDSQANKDLHVVKQTGTLSNDNHVPVTVSSIGHRARNQIARSDESQIKNAGSETSIFWTFTELLGFASLVAGAACVVTQTEKGRAILLSLGLVKPVHWTKEHLPREESKLIALALETPLIQQALDAMGLATGLRESGAQMAYQPVELDESWCPSSVEGCRKNAEEKLRMACQTSYESEEFLPMEDEFDPSIQMNLQAEVEDADLLGTSETPKRGAVPDGASPFLKDALIDAMAEDAGDLWDGSELTLTQDDQPLIFPAEEKLVELASEVAVEPTKEFQTISAGFSLDDDDLLM